MSANIIGPAGSGIDTWLGDVYSSSYSKTYTPTVTGTYTVYLWSRSYDPDVDPRSDSASATRTFTVSAPPTVTVSPMSWNPGSAAQTSGTFTVTANVSWVAWSSDPTWLGISTTSGNSGTTNCTMNVLANPNTTSRSGKIYFSSGGVVRAEITVTQAAKPMTTNPPVQCISSGKTATSITIKEITPPSGWTTQYRMRPVSSSNWGNWQTGNTFSGLTAATGYRFQARFAANTSTREDSKPGPESVTITTASSPYKLDVSPTELSYTLSGGDNYITVTSNVSWSWVDLPGWLTVLPGYNPNEYILRATPTTSARYAEFTVSGGGTSRKVTVIQTSDPMIHRFDAYASADIPAIELRASIENAAEIRVYLNNKERADVRVTNHTLAPDVYIKTVGVAAGTYATRLDISNGNDSWTSSTTKSVTVTAVNPALKDVAYIKSYNYGVNHIDNTETRMSIIKYSDGSFVCSAYTDAGASNGFYLNQSLIDEIEFLHDKYLNDAFYFLTRPLSERQKAEHLSFGKVYLNQAISNGLNITVGSDEYYAWWVIFSTVDKLYQDYSNAKMQVIMNVVADVLLIVQVGLLVNQIRTLSKMEVSYAVDTGPGYTGQRDLSADFRDGASLAGHFKDHGAQMGYTSEQSYLAGARQFFDKTPTVSTRSFISRDGWYFRYDAATNEFGIISNFGGISTYMFPDEPGLAYWLTQIQKYAIY